MLLYVFEALKRRIWRVEGRGCLGDSVEGMAKRVV